DGVGLAVLVHDVVIALASGSEAASPVSRNERNGTWAGRGEGPRGGLQVYPARQCHNTRRRRQNSSRTRLFFGGNSRPNPYNRYEARRGSWSAAPGPQTATPDLADVGPKEAPPDSSVSSDCRIDRRYLQPISFGESHRSAQVEGKAVR